MSDIDDPEDAYEASDPLPVRLRNLDLRLRYLIERALVVGEVAERIRRVRDDLRTAFEELER